MEQFSADFRSESLRRSVCTGDEPILLFVGRQAHQSVKKFSWREINLGLLQYYQRLLDERRN